ncbi:aldo/keto reductase [Aeromicrobium fastidiosum]|uniref:Aldo/keto reductase n=1 Tax=Aeromicrobium fastidiosum TaxID=52699 RepID=A0A641ARC0_9ACTN|nr:aldo/keto reductase [Aeromicrobium fastidiosum]KAA1380654.1 aldo/keto reductase [Aeromicrobium fastidiosum]MBP2390262.1 aryl-alcohol dehydrogenase (NADP+) [Aeromicrobium fastidiosum]
MERVQLGDSDLEVSEIILGCMSYGDPGRGTHAWSLPEDESRPFIRQALEAGITTFDTANMYSDGSSEEIVGRALADFARREDVEIATKVFFPMDGDPDSGGLSAAAIAQQIDDSLRRLGTDYVDLYQIHRWDPAVPIEETMEALDLVVRSGKARFIGASSMWAWQLAQAQHAADLNGWTPFVSMQDQYNLVQREDEREMHPFCLDEGIGVIPWSPLARGRLTRDWDDVSTERSGSDHVTQKYYRQAEDSDRAIADAVGAIADAREVSRAQVALAWVRQQEVVTAPIVGATKPLHLDDAVASIDLVLDADELAALEDPYVPRLPEF